MIRIFGSFLSFEFKRLSCKRKLLIFLLITASFIYLVQDGINEYEYIIQNLKTFQEVEKLFVSKFTTIEQYAIYGFRISLNPSPLTVLFYKSSLFSDIAVTINNAERLEIYSPVKGKILFSEKLGGYIDFSEFVYLLGCFLAYLYGLETFKDKEYLKFKSALVGYKQVFLLETLSRVLFLNLVFLLCAGISFAWAFINGIQIFNIFILWYIIMTIALLNFFFSLGLNLGAIKIKFNQIFIFVLVYIVLVSLIPLAIDKIISKKAEQMTPLYHAEMEKLDIYIKFERRALENQGKYSKEKGKTFEGRNLIESFWTGEFVQMLEIEERMIKEIEENAHTFQLYSMFFPTSFYKSVIFEISSRGFSSFLEYYRDTKEKDKQFMRLYLNKRYYSESEKVESFIKKGDENIFYTRSTLPFTFWPGLLLTFFYNFFALVMAYKLNGKAFKIVKPKMVGIEFPKGQNAAFILCENGEVKAEIFRYYQQQDNAVCLDRIDTSDFNFDDVKPNTVFKHICIIAGVDKTKAVENLELLGVEIKSLKTLSHESILKMYAAIMTSLEFDNLVLNDFLKGESRRFEKSFFNLLLNQGEQIIYLSCEMYNQAASLNDSIKVETFKAFDLPLEAGITLR